MPLTSSPAPDASVLHHLNAFGLHLASVLPIPGSQSLPHRADAQPDLTICYGTAPILAASTGFCRYAGPYCLTPETLTIHLPGIADFCCGLDGTLLTVDPAPAVTPEHLEAVLVATALPAMLWLRGDCILHAAAAVLPGHCKALAFAGHSGAGKSSLLRSLLEHGAAAVGDDSLALRPVPATLQAAGLPACTLHRTDPSGDAPRRRLSVPNSRQLAFAPLVSIVILQPRPHTPAPEPLRRLHGPEALAACLSNLHRPRVPQLLGRAPWLLHFLADLVQRIPIFAWNIPAGRTPTLSPLLHLAETLPGLQTM